jgi:hypothetical protein
MTRPVSIRNSSGGRGAKVTQAGGGPKGIIAKFRATVSVKTIATQR